MLAKAKWIAGCLRACLGAAAGLQQSQWSSAAVGAVCPVCVLSRSQHHHQLLLCVSCIGWLDFAWPSFCCVLRAMWVWLENHMSQHDDFDHDE